MRCGVMLISLNDSASLHHPRILLGHSPPATQDTLDSSRQQIATSPNWETRFLDWMPTSKLATDLFASLWAESCFVDRPVNEN